MIKSGYAKVFYDFIEATSMLDDAEVGRLTKAIVKYARGERESAEEELTGNERIIFPMFKLQLDRDAEKAEETAAKNRENGAKGGRPRKEEKPNSSGKNPNNPVGFSETEKSQDNDNDYEEDYDYEEEKDSVINHNHNHSSSQNNVFANEEAGVIPAGDWKRVSDAYHYEIGGLPTGTALEMFRSYVDDLGADAVIAAIKQTGMDQPDCMPWKWLKRILDRFADLHVHDAEGAQAALNDWERTKQARKKGAQAPPPQQDDKPVKFLR